MLSVKKFRSEVLKHFSVVSSLVSLNLVRSLELGINSLRTEAHHETQQTPIELKGLLHKYVMLACKVDTISAGFVMLFDIYKTEG